ncbi:MAG: aminoacyl-tRNA hydrolase [Acidobacteria bacterium]|nr:aminoacyl-tRNA hydrolase [Acidobacteriota bacterium]
MKRVKLVVGLGNPGPEYEFSPHNMGFGVVERLAERNGVRLSQKRAHSRCGRFLQGEEEIWLIQPQTFMNRSGLAVKEWLTREGCEPQDLIIIADDLDLPWGSLRIRQKGGSAGHHGLESIVGAMGTQQFTRVRIGVSPDRELQDPVDYLLAPLGRSRRSEAKAIWEQAAEAVEMILTAGTEKAMTVFNRRKGATTGTARQPANEKRQETTN